MVPGSIAPWDTLFLPLDSCPALTTRICWSDGQLPETGLAAPGCYAEMHRMGPPTDTEIYSVHQKGELMCEKPNKENALRKNFGFQSEKNKIPSGPYFVGQIPSPLTFSKSSFLSEGQTLPPVPFSAD